MTLIYDFDGTLTPYKNPQFPILTKIGSIDEFYENLSQKADLMTDFCPTLKEYLNNHGYAYNLENICYNAHTIELNPGVIDFLSYFHDNKDYQFIVTSSYEEYVKNTLVAPFCNGIFGTKPSEIKNEIMWPDKKIKTIAKLIKQYNLNPQEIVYIGDGYTDRFAFEYIKKGGGKSIFVYNENDDTDQQTLTTLQNLNVIDESFPKDFTLNGSLFSYITNLNKRLQ